MHRFLLKVLFLSLSLLFVLPASAQVKRVITCNPMSRSQASYMEVYEYDYVDVQPQFPGGERALISYINKKREYPYDAYKRHIEGRVVCSFVVNSDGSISNVSIIKGTPLESMNREAMRVIRCMPKWKAGRVGGEAVPVLCILPIAFRL
jgi:protein TonB